MRTRPFRRAAALALAGTIAIAGVASADTVQADGDLVTAGVQGAVHAGSVVPGAEVSITVGFVLVCGNVQHVDAGQTVTLNHAGGVQPDDGEIVSVTEGAVGPVPESWTADAEGCPFPAPRLEGGTASTVTLRAPTTLGEHEFLVEWSRSVAPAGQGDASAVTGMTVVAIGLEVVQGTGDPEDTTAPTLAGVPADMVATTGDPTGAVVTFDTPTATDDTDPDPVVACAPASGTWFPTGTTTVTCTATDSAGNHSQGSFDVTVTYVPPGEVSATWGEPVGAAGATVFANRGRTLPVKVTFAPAGGVGSADAALRIAPCGSPEDAVVLPLRVTGDHWQAQVSTGALVGECHVVSAWLGDAEAASFQLRLQVDGNAAAKGAGKGR
ncbi:hypothetical protein BH20CHL7_BH20CHL7_00430 [soil metagenome]